MDTDPRFKTPPPTRYTDRHRALTDALREYETTLTRKGTPVTVGEYEHHRGRVLDAMRGVVEQIEQDEERFTIQEAEEA